jgi:phospholipase C
MRRPVRALTLTAAAGLFAAMAFGITGAIATGAGSSNAGSGSGGTATPIKHLVVIFDENISFDHYFGTYPAAANPAGEPVFHAASGTPTVSGLLPTWRSTAVVITYDDSDGWYHHILGPITTASQTSLDTLNGAGTCGAQASQVPVNSAMQPEQGRCGLGVRIPLLVVSPWSRSDFVDNTLTDQSSVLKFIEHNWSVPALGNGSTDAASGSPMSMFDFSSQMPPNAQLFLNPGTGERISFSYWASQLATS